MPVLVRIWQWRVNCARRNVKCPHGVIWWGEWKVNIMFNVMRCVLCHWGGASCWVCLTALESTLRCAVLKKNVCWGLLNFCACLILSASHNWLIATVTWLTKNLLRVPHKNNLSLFIFEWSRSCYTHFFYFFFSVVILFFGNVLLQFASSHCSYDASIATCCDTGIRYWAIFYKFAGLSDVGVGVGCR